MINHYTFVGYKRVGPMAATCVDGNWSPDVKAACEAGKHPKLMYIFRGRRSVDVNLLPIDDTEALTVDVEDEENAVDTTDKYASFDKGKRGN